MQLVLPKFDHYNPELFLLHRGIEVFFAYKEEGDEPLNYSYVTDRQSDSSDGFDFDVRNLAPVTNVRKQHADAIRHAIDRKLPPFENITLDGKSEYALSEAETLVFQVLHPGLPAPEHSHALYRAIEHNTFHCALFQALRTPQAREGILQAHTALYYLKTECLMAIDAGLHAIGKVKTPG